MMPAIFGRTERRAGFTMVELLIAMVVLSVVMGAAVSVLRSQSPK